MFRTAQLTRDVGHGPRTYNVTYLDGSPGREEAVRYFKSNASKFFRDLGLPSEIDSMPHAKAQEFLDANPQLKAWGFLQAHFPRVSDEDLRRLEHLPELGRVYLFGEFDNYAISQLTYLSRVFDVCVHSNKVTDDCLNHLSKLQSIQRIDLYGSPNISKHGLLDLKKQFTNVEIIEPLTTADGG